MFLLLENIFVHKTLKYSKAVGATRNNLAIKKKYVSTVTTYRRNRNYRLLSLVLGSHSPSRRMPACRNSAERVEHPSSMCTGVNFVAIKGRARVPCALA